EALPSGPAGRNPWASRFLLPERGLANADFALAPVTGARGQAAPVRAERHAPHVAYVTPYGREFLLLRDVPEPHDLILTHCRQLPSVRADRQAEGPQRVGHGAPPFPRRHIPEFHVPAADRRGQKAAVGVGAERHGPGDPPLRAEQVQSLFSGDFPDTNRIR